MLDNEDQNPVEDKKEPQQTNVKKPKNSNLNEQQKSK